MSFDDNALFRQGEVVELRDFDEEDPKEVEASGHGLNYIALDGSVGCIVNGAGLAMGTMDAIVAPRRPPGELPRRGGRREPGEDRERVPHRAAGPERARDPGEHLRRDQPMRLDRAGRRPGDARPGDRGPDRSSGWPGTNVDEGRPILDESGLTLIQAEDLDDAAAKAVAATRPWRHAGGAGMSVFVDRDSKVDHPGLHRPARDLPRRGGDALGTQVVGGRHARARAARTHLGLPVFNSVEDAVEATGRDRQRHLRARRRSRSTRCTRRSEAGIQIAVIIADGVPVQDMVRTKRYLAGRSTTIIGPNSPGIITPGECKVGIMPSHIYAPGRIGVVSRSRHAELRGRLADDRARASANPPASASAATP